MAYNFSAKGQIALIHDEIEASVTSANTAALDCTGFNALLVYVDLDSSGTPNWTIDIESSYSKTGTYADCYDATMEIGDGTGGMRQLTTGALTADRVILFRGIGDWVKAVPTENSGTGSCTVRLQPVNI